MQNASLQHSLTISPPMAPDRTEALPGGLEPGATEVDRTTVQFDLSLGKPEDGDAHEVPGADLLPVAVASVFTFLPPPVSSKAEGVAELSVTDTPSGNIVLASVSPRDEGLSSEVALVKGLLPVAGPPAAADPARGLPAASFEDQGGGPEGNVTARGAGTSLVLREWTNGFVGPEGGAGLSVPVTGGSVRPDAVMETGKPGILRAETASAAEPSSPEPAAQSVAGVALARSGRGATSGALPDIDARSASRPPFDGGDRSLQIGPLAGVLSQDPAEPPTAPFLAMGKGELRLRVMSIEPGAFLPNVGSAFREATSVPLAVSDLGGDVNVTMGSVPDLDRPLRTTEPMTIGRAAVPPTEARITSPDTPQPLPADTVAEHGNTHLVASDDLPSKSESAVPEKAEIGPRKRAAALTGPVAPQSEAARVPDRPVQSADIATLGEKTDPVFVETGSLSNLSLSDLTPGQPGPRAEPGFGITLRGHPTSTAVAQQVLSALSGPEISPITELRLSPEELGSVRIEIRTEGDRVVMVVAAERPDTLDLLRRGSDRLIADLRDTGFAQLDLSFGQWTGSARDEASSRNVSTVPDAGLSDWSSPGPVAHLASPTSVSGGGLYLRI